jgi:hypothetical protein
MGWEGTLAYSILYFLLGVNLLLFPGAGNNSEISGHIPKHWHVKIAINS